MKPVSIFVFGQKFVLLLGLSFFLSACGGGGSGQHLDPVQYPYETVYRDVCKSSEPSPGCTFNRLKDARITVSEDPDYNNAGNGTQDMWYVKFYGTIEYDYWTDEWVDSAYGKVYDEFGNHIGTYDIDYFDGFMEGPYIGVGGSGFYWEDVRGGTYWYGGNGILYNANAGESNYGEAINNNSADDMADTNMAALSSESNKQLVDAAKKMLIQKYGFKASKAEAVASALNRWGVTTVERGFTTPSDMNTAFTTVFGVSYRSALAAVKSYIANDKEPIKNLTERSAAALGLKPHQAKAFIKDMYKDGLAHFGYDVNQIDW